MDAKEGDKKNAKDDARKNDAAADSLPPSAVGGKRIVTPQRQQPSIDISDAAGKNSKQLASAGPQNHPTGERLPPPAGGGRTATHQSHPPHPPQWYSYPPPPPPHHMPHAPPGALPYPCPPYPHYPPHSYGPPSHHSHPSYPPHVRPPYPGQYSGPPRPQPRAIKSSDAEKEKKEGESSSTAPPNSSSRKQGTIAVSPRTGGKKGLERESSNPQSAPNDTIVPTSGKQSRVISPSSNEETQRSLSSNTAQPPSYPPKNHGAYPPPPPPPHPYHHHPYLPTPGRKPSNGPARKLPPGMSPIPPPHAPPMPYPYPPNAPPHPNMPWKSPAVSPYPGHPDGSATAKTSSPKSEAEDSHYCASDEAPNSLKRCFALKPPLPSRFYGDNNVAAEARVPDFHKLINFPDFSSKNRLSGQPGSTVPAGTSRCVMCGNVRLCTASSTMNKGKSKAGSAAQSEGASTTDESPQTLVGSKKHESTLHIIPRQNKGLCTACDVTVWVVTESRMEIKWCKGCKNFRPWAAFGEKDLATKCVRCRKRQREKYATQKNGLREKRQKQRQLQNKRTGPEQKKEMKEEISGDANGLSHLLAATTHVAQ